MKLVLKLAILSTLTLCTPAAAQYPLGCNDRLTIIERLNERYNESLVGIGIATGPQVMEILSSPNGETWTILSTGTDGISCLVMTGSDFEFHEPVELPKKPQL